MNPHFQPSIMLFRFMEGDPCYQDVAVFVTLGKGATALIERLRDYVLAIPECNWMGDLGPLAAFPLSTGSISKVSRDVPTILAISGQLSEEEIKFAARLMERGGHCTVLVDAATEIRPEWRSVVRLPAGKPRDEQWLFGMQAYLDALFNHGLVCLDSENIHACTKQRLSQFTLVHSQGENWAIDGVESAIQELSGHFDLKACDTFLFLFHTGPGVRLKEIHWGVQACKNGLNSLMGQEYLLNVGHLPRLDKGFAVSLMAGTPRPLDLSDPVHPDHILF